MATIMAVPNDIVSCPRCGRRLSQPNEPHPCGWHFESSYLTGRTPRMVDLYRRFADTVQRCGPVVRVPMRTRIGFQAHSVFAAVLIRNEWLDVYVVLPRRVEHPRFARIDEDRDLGVYVHHFSIGDLPELDGDVVGWLQAAYDADTVATPPW